MEKFKRYCKTLTLRNDPELIRQYEEVHQRVWPEILQGMREVGILDMEIWRYGNRLFMIMDTVTDFDHDRAMAALAQKPHQKEWEAYVSKFQNTSPEATADEKWQLMKQVFKM